MNISQIKENKLHKKHLCNGELNGKYSECGN